MQLPLYRRSTDAPFADEYLQSRRVEHAIEQALPDRRDRATFRA